MVRATMQLEDLPREEAVARYLWGSIPWPAMDRPAGSTRWSVCLTISNTESGNCPHVPLESGEGRLRRLTRQGPSTFAALRAVADVSIPLSLWTPCFGTASDHALMRHWNSPFHCDLHLWHPRLPWPIAVEWAARFRTPKPPWAGHDAPSEARGRSGR